jgi:hypothetical protein
MDHFQLATGGVGPGWTTFNMATSGFGFEIEVTVTPVTGGGGGRGTIWDQNQPYQITVRIKYKDKTWEEKRLVSPLFGDSLAKVLAAFKSMKTRTITIATSINNILQRDVGVLWRK